MADGVAWRERCRAWRIRHAEIPVRRKVKRGHTFYNSLLTFFSAPGSSTPYPHSVNRGVKLYSIPLAWAVNLTKSCVSP
jgi:hypothetical protein